MLYIHSFVFNPFAENTYILWESETLQAWIIDPGCHNISEQNILHGFITKNHLNIIAIINTHGHIDHILGNGWSSRTYQLPVTLFEGEMKSLQHSLEWGKGYGLDAGESPESYILIQEDTILTLGKYNFKVLHTPGHSVGSICIYNPDSEILVSGDVLFKDSYGRYDLWGGDLNQLRVSIIDKLFSLPDSTRVFPGHGPDTTIGYEKENNPILY